MNAVLQIFVVATMLTALYLLYRIAYPKQPAKQADGEVSEKETKPARSVMGKSRFVLPDRSKPVQTPAISAIAEPEADKAISFAPENQEKRLAVIPADELDEVFADEPDPDDLEIEEDDDQDNEIDIAAEEETEAMTRGDGLAEGLDFDDLQHVANVVKEQPETVNRETGAKIAALEHTDVFERLVSGDEGKMNWIKSVIDRHIQSNLPETESNISDTDEGNFEIAEFLRLND
jgi:hypothetical protein